jgi:two-component system, chemotaxis family, sensor kinase CheA
MPPYWGDGRLALNDQQEIVNEFLIESYENLEQLDRDLVTLEQDPASQSILASIFRTIHTIKGTCGFLGFGKLESVAHVGENLLSKLRDGALRLRPDITTALLALVDAIREILGNIESIGAEGEADYTNLVQTLIQMLKDGGESHSPAAPPVATAPETQVQALPTEVPAERVVLGDEETAHLEKTEHRHSSASDSTVRVDVGLLDKLMNRVGELVLARNQILQFTSTLSDSALLSTAQRLNLITTELQEGVMKTRMQPIGNIWSKFSRVVRDLAVQCGKQVRIEMEGKETELDKSIIEAIKDPLTHLIRNAVDHGIEPPEVRLAAGKPAEGCLLLRAFHEGGQVNIEVIDNGAGLNLDRVRQKAIERGLIGQDQAHRLTDREVTQLIFAPGFSTATTVTNVSGRGVGLDVVRTNIEKIGGSVDLQNRPGQGTTIKLKIPLTLAIIPALIVTCGGDRYAIPQVSLLELVRLDGEQAQKGIERLHGAPVYRLRGKLLPIVDLSRELELEPRESPQDAVNIVVLQADDRQFGLVVDSINDTEEIVVKPLSQQLKGISVYAGATIMGDGKVALILDVLGTAQRAHVVSGIRERTLADHPSKTPEGNAARQTLLVLTVGSRRLALPIAMVSRLEEVPRSQIEHAGFQEVIQCRGEILPLVRLGQFLNLQSEVVDQDRPLQVVVYRGDNHSIGLVVDKVADIVETDVPMQRHEGSDGYLTSVVIQDRVTEMLDVAAMIRRDGLLSVKQTQPLAVSSGSRR